MYKLNEILNDLHIYQQNKHTQIDYLNDRLNDSLISYYKDVMQSYEYVNRQKIDSIKRKILK